MRYLPILLTLAGVPVHGAEFPVYTSDPPPIADKQLTLNGFGAFGGLTVGVSHHDIAADAPTYYHAPVDAAQFWLTSFDDYVAIELTGDPPGYTFKNHRLALPFYGLGTWQQLGNSPRITVSVTGWTLDESRPWVQLNIAATDGTTTLTDRYTLDVHRLPEPTSWAMALVSALALSTSQNQKLNPRGARYVHRVSDSKSGPKSTAPAHAPRSVRAQ
jgi:hypothetical protein